jgi:hypothetical protein
MMCSDPSRSIDPRICSGNHPMAKRSLMSFRRCVERVIFEIHGDRDISSVALGVRVYGLALVVIYLMQGHHSALLLSMHQSDAPAHATMRSTKAIALSIARRSKATASEAIVPRRITPQHRGDQGVRKALALRYPLSALGNAGQSA